MANTNILQLPVAIEDPDDFGVPLAKIDALGRFCAEAATEAGWLVRRFGVQLWMSRTDYLLCRNLAADTGQEAPPEGIRF